MSRTCHHCGIPRHRIPDGITHLCIQAITDYEDNIHPPHGIYDGWAFINHIIRQVTSSQPNPTKAVIHTTTRRILIDGRH